MTRPALMRRHQELPGILPGVQGAGRQLLERLLDEHAYGPRDLGQVAAGHHGGRLVVDADLEAGRAPVHNLDGPLGLDGGDGRVDVLGDDIAPVEHAAGHVLAVVRVSLHHLVGRLEAGVCNLSHTELLVVSLLGGDDRSAGDEREVDPGVGHQVRLREAVMEETIWPMSLSKGSVDLKQVSTTLISRLLRSSSKTEFQYRASDMSKERR